MIRPAGELEVFYFSRLWGSFLLNKFKKMNDKQSGFAMNIISVCLLWAYVF